MKFINQIRQKAKAASKTIVLPEGVDDRVIEAAKVLNDEGIAKTVLLGCEKTIRQKGIGEGYTTIEIIDPKISKKSAEYAWLLFKLREHKGMTFKEAKEQVLDPIWFATLMVKNKDVDGMVAGTSISSGDVFRPAFQIVKTAPGMGVVSSAFIMIVPNCSMGSNGIMLFADCAINPNPNAKQLAEIAISSAKTWESLIGGEPKVAMLSFSTKGSAQHELVDKVVEATNIVRERAPNLRVDGELQADSALVTSVARAKAPESTIGGEANVLVFPDLNAGNIGYKLVQRLAKAEAVGPVSQGLASPINDLSRGCSVDDIISLVALTSLQAIS